MPLKRLARMQALEAQGLRKAAVIAPPRPFLPSLEILPPSEDQPSPPDPIQYQGTADVAGAADILRAAQPSQPRTA